MNCIFNPLIILEVMVFFLLCNGFLIETDCFVEVMMVCLAPCFIGCLLSGSVCQMLLVVVLWFSLISSLSRMYLFFVRANFVTSRTGFSCTFRVAYTQI